jgi:hypothetical protein
MEVYELPCFPAHLHGQPFAVVALFLYQEYHSVLLGTVPRGSWASTEAQLAPFEQVRKVGAPACCMLCSGVPWWQPLPRRWP